MDDLIPIEDAPSSALPQDFDLTPYQKIKSVTWSILLYPDDPLFDFYMDNIRISFPDSWASITHDKDRYDDNDAEINSDIVPGALKKAHVHIVLYFGRSEKILSMLARKIGIKPNYIKRVNNYKRALRYLVHADDPDKAQYSVEDVQGPLKETVRKLLVSSNLQSMQIMDMIEQGASNYDILKAFPTAYSKIPQLDQLRQVFVREKYKKMWRDLEVTYIWGDSGSGKTRFVMEKYGYENVYRISSYEHPFDQYQGQEVILFDEFRSSLKLADMLSYLDGYPLELPCRYNNKQACYTKVFIISNIPLRRQYGWIQEQEYESYKAFLRRIHNVFFMGEDYALVDDCTPFD